MDHSRSDVIIEWLRSADLTVLGVLAGASNHTLLVRMDDGDRYAVYKPRRGERPLWDFPSGTLYRREVAAYVVSRFLGWDLVPPTVSRDGPLGVGSVQQFVAHDPAEHYFTLVEDTRHHPRLAQLATFDLLVNNADRKGGHVLRTTDADRLIGIDHGLTFHIEPKLRTVIWELGGMTIAQQWREDLDRLGVALADGGGALACLGDLLQDAEIAALRRRAELLASTAVLPDLEPGRRPYPWPPL